MQEASPIACGVLVQERRELAVARVTERKGKRPALQDRLLQRFGVVLPRGPKRAVTSDRAWAGIRFNSWLVTGTQEGDVLCQALKEELVGLASVVDQSDGLAVVQLTGPKACATLGTLAPVDVHPNAFKVLDVATTVMAQVSVTLWRINDLPDGTSAFELAIPRSYLSSFSQVLSYAAFD